MGRLKLSMRVSMLNQNYAFNIFSTCFQKNIFIFYIHNMGPNAQIGKGSENKIPKHNGSGGVNIQNSPLAKTFFIRFQKSFR